MRIHAHRSDAAGTRRFGRRLALLFASWVLGACGGGGTADPADGGSDAGEQPVGQIQVDVADRRTVVLPGLRVQQVAVVRLRVE